jgi:hypothetical protein
MNCGTFQKQLENYLEDKLDFAGRFAIERHAERCVHCGRDLITAQELGRMARGLPRIKAPSDFESSVLREVAARKLYRRFSLFERFPIFGIEHSVWRRVAVAASGFLLIGLGLFYWNGLDTNPALQNGVMKADIHQTYSGAQIVDNIGGGYPADPSTKGEPPPGSPDARTDRDGRPQTLYFQADGSDYREYEAIGPDDLPMIVPLPNTIWMEINLPSEDYFIQNVSH